MIEGVLPMLDTECWGLRAQGLDSGGACKPEEGETEPEETMGGERYVLSMGYELKRTAERACDCSATVSKAEEEAEELVLSVSDDPSVLSSVTSTEGITVSVELVLVEGVMPIASLVVGVRTALAVPSMYESKYPPR